MPFFLSSKPAKATGKLTASARPKLVVKDQTKVQPNAAPSSYGRTLLWLCLGLGVGIGAGVGWFFARKALRDQVAITAPAPMGKGSVVLDVPPWISPADAHAVIESLESCLSSDPLDGESLAQVAHSLESQRAIGHVRRIWRETDGRVHCLVDWHAPAGIVVGHGGTSLSVVDIQGHLLAESLTEDAAKNFQALYPVPRIEGVATPAPDGGKVWDDLQLQAGLKVLRLLLPTVGNRILALRVGDRDAQKRPDLSFILETAEGPLDILWGLPEGAEAGVDAPAQDKLKALAVLCADKSVRSGQAGSAHFSIRHGKVMVTEIPPPATPATTPKAGNGRKP